MLRRYTFSNWLFLRGISLVYFTAFVSLAVQVLGLWGENGILPAAGFLSAVEKSLGPEAYWRLPSVFWIHAGDAALMGVAWFGGVAALLALVGLAEGIALAICFVSYLSFVTAGQDFMSFQWDSLLLEAGFLSLFAASWRLRRTPSAASPETHWSVRGLFYVLLFKLMFLSGVVKLASGDPAWRDLTALGFHYWTQPIPNPVALFLHAMPGWFHAIATGLVFAIELLVPFLVFWPRARIVAAASFAGLSVLIIASGNYAFFNWLTILLALWLVDDRSWRRMGSPVRNRDEAAEASVAANPRASAATDRGFGSLFFVARGIVISALLALSLFWSTQWALPSEVQSLVWPIARPASEWRISNPYGLFATMTKSRPEIVIEGSLDGNEWKEYEFRYKAGSPARRPPLVAPHQPRLDWQMWFAALGRYEQSPWLQNLLIRLLQRSPDVIDLFEHDPFAGKSPRLVRARLYEYEFTSPSELYDSRQWWRRKLVGDFSPTLRRE